jgi:hypothetical protein
MELVITPTVAGVLTCRQSVALCLGRSLCVPLHSRLSSNGLPLIG